MVVAVLLLAAGMAAAWEPDVRLTDNSYSDFTYWSAQRRVAVDSVGRVHVIWYVMNSGLGTYRFQIYYKRFNPGTGWTQDTMLSADLYADSTNNKYPAMTVDASGRVVAIWGNDTSDGADAFIYYKTCMPEGDGNGGWDSISRLVSAGTAGHTREYPNLAATPDGHVHAVWREVKPGGSICLAYRELTDTVWQPQVDLELNSNYKVYPAVAGGPDNSVHVVWHGRNGPSGNYNYDIYGARVTPGGTVLDPSGFVISQAADDQWSPALGFDGANFLVVWTDYRGSSYDIYGARVTTGGTVYDEGPVVRQEGDQEYPSLARGSGSQMFLVYQGWAGTVGGKTYNTDRIWGKMDPSPGVEEIENSEVRRVKGGATVIRGVLRTVDSRQNTAHRAEPSDGGRCGQLLDAMGRKVLALKPGANDVSRLKPGVYFVRAVSRQPSAVSRKPSAVTKVVITK
jgi:hypothetical protein